MSKKFVALAAVAAVVFDLIACIGDSNLTVYNLFMGLCCASFCLFVFGLFRVQFSKKKDDDMIYATEKEKYKKAA